MKQHQTWEALGLLILLGFVWGSGYTLSRYAMTHGVPPLGYAFWQTLGPALLLGVCGGFSRTSTLRNKTYWPFFLVCGLTGIAIPNTNMYFLASHVPAGLLAVLVNTVPLMIYPIALASGLERFDALRFSAILLGFAGIIMLAPSPEHPTALSFLALLSPLAFAVCSVYIGTRGKLTPNPMECACGMLVAASLLLTPVVLVRGAFYSPAPPWNLVKGVVLLEIFLSTLGYILFFRLIRIAGPVFYSLTGGVVALTGLFWGRVVFDEHQTTLQLIAVGCVTGAIGLLSMRQSATAHTGE